MSYTDFYDLKDLAVTVLKNATIAVDADKVEWTKVRKCEPSIIQFK